MKARRTSVIYQVEVEGLLLSSMKDLYQQNVAFIFLEKIHQANAAAARAKRATKPKTPRQQVGVIFSQYLL